MQTVRMADIFNSLEEIISPLGEKLQRIKSETDSQST